MILVNLTTSDYYEIPSCVHRYYNIYGDVTIINGVTGRTLLLLIDKQTKWSVIKNIIDNTQREFISCELVLLDTYTNVPKTKSNLYTLVRVQPEYLTQYITRKAGVFLWKPNSESTHVVEQE